MQFCCAEWVIETTYFKVTSENTPYTCSDVKFEDLNLSRELLKGLYVEMKFERPSKIQSRSLPMILTPPYKNLIAQSHNGSGKTTCFVLGRLSRVDPKLAVPQALCICPTRELAIQNMEVVLKMGKYTGITSELAIPANKANYIPVSKRAPVTAQVVVGTPGTINKWIAAKKLGTSYLKILVFDEADHMLAEGGFKEDSVRIMKEIVRWSPKCQVLLFSATFNDTVKDFQSKIVNDLFVQGYNEFFLEKEELPLDSVKQYKVNLPDELSKIMVNMVVNYDLPVINEKPTEPDNEGYLHHIGRAGRFGLKGAVFNLLCGDRDNMIMEKIERHFNHYATEVPSWTSDDEFKNALKKAGLMKSS
ncbi:hypothetical protein L1987_35432 [Smallanthus sonchifolius]|uniref:Uncharacterized protein n=1 Tax=Smallanthus sonchifolius TaxID=185202 RepID=A0ACB9HWB7_9ASTR|nr:hypothetical protein L1987_35432 [Smallanthus sonchifolius]